MGQRSGGGTPRSGVPARRVLLQVGGAVPTTPWELVLTSSRETQVVLVVLVIFSIGVLVPHRPEVVAVPAPAAAQADRFMAEIEKAPRLDDAYRAAMRLPSSPYNRVLREGVHFFSELKPGALKNCGAGTPDAGSTLTATQLEALRMVLAKEVAAERDAAARFVPWLATFGSVSPLLGLLGTVLGVMDAFIGIAVGGSGNIAAVAPGVAEALVTTVMGLAVAVPVGDGVQHPGQPARSVRRRAGRICAGNHRDDGARGVALGGRPPGWRRVARAR